MVQLLDEFVQVISTKADTRGFDVLDRKQKRAINNTSILSKSFSRMFGFIGGALALNSLKNYADEWTNIESTLRLVSGTEEERLRVEEKLFNTSQRTRQSMGATVDLYRRIAISAKSLNLSENDRLQAVETINKAVLVGGGTSASQQAALFQLGQGLASGQLRGQELNSILEQTPRLAQLIAEGMGKDVGDLRKLAEKGTLTPTQVMGAILSQTQKINAEFSKMKPTIGQALTTLNNSFGKLISRTEKAGSLTEIIAKNIERLATAISSPKVVNSMKLIGILIKSLLDNFKLLVGFYMFKRFMRGEIFTLFLLNLKDGIGLVKSLAFAFKASSFANMIKTGTALALAWGKYALVLALIIDAIETLQGKDTLTKRIGEGFQKMVDKPIFKALDWVGEKTGLWNPRMQPYAMSEMALSINKTPIPQGTSFSPTINITNAQNLDENLLSQRIGQELQGQFTRFNMKQGFIPIR